MARNHLPPIFWHLEVPNITNRTVLFVCACIQEEVIFFSRELNWPPKIHAPCPEHNVNLGRCSKKSLIPTPSNHHHCHHVCIEMEPYDTPWHWNVRSNLCHFQNKMDNNWVCLLHSSCMEWILECRGHSHNVKGVWAPEWPHGKTVNLEYPL